MRTTLLFLLITSIFTFFTSCNNDDDNNSEKQFESTAIIRGYDLNLCGCCGGWITEIDGEESIKRFSELPKNSNIVLDIKNTEFPISVLLNWSESESEEFCGRGITIESIALNE